MGRSDENILRHEKRRKRTSLAGEQTSRCSCPPTVWGDGRVQTPDRCKDCNSPILSLPAQTPRGPFGPLLGGTQSRWATRQWGIAKSNGGRRLALIKKIHEKREGWVRLASIWQNPVRGHDGAEQEWEGETLCQKKIQKIAKCHSRSPCVFVVPVSLVFPFPPLLLITIAQHSTFSISIDSILRLRVQSSPVLARSHTRSHRHRVHPAIEPTPGSRARCRGLDLERPSESSSKQWHIAQYGVGHRSRPRHYLTRLKRHDKRFGTCPASTSPPPL